MRTKEFEHGDKKYIVKTPTARQSQDGKRVYLKAWNDARQDSILRPNMDQFLQENGLWGPKDDAQLTSIDAKIEELEKFLEEGNCDEETGSQKAIECQQLRLEKLALVSKKGNYDGVTAEAQAENAQFDYLVSVCLVYDNNELVFGSFDAFLDSEETELIELASNLLSELIHGVSWETFLTDTPEYRFLEKKAAESAAQEEEEKPKPKTPRKRKTPAKTAG